ncbi:Uncharacterised protein [Yersinia enterocolitica]|nr:Uncharacterised protein [Yersinia enterocolitica]
MKAHPTHVFQLKLSAPAITLPYGHGPETPFETRLLVKVIRYLIALPNYIFLIIPIIYDVEHLNK